MDIIRITIRIAKYWLVALGVFNWQMQQVDTLFRLRLCNWQSANCCRRGRRAQSNYRLPATGRQSRIPPVYMLLRPQSVGLGPLPPPEGQNTQDECHLSMALHPPSRLLFSKSFLATGLILWPVAKMRRFKKDASLNQVPCSPWGQCWPSIPLGVSKFFQ
jgi:hypothetical protein